MKKYVYLYIILIFVLYLAGCSNEKSVNIETMDNSQNVITAVPSITTAKQPPTITPSIVPTNPASISYIPESTSDWNPNHGTVNIIYEKANRYDNFNEYVFISPTEGWKAYIGPIGAGQDFIVLYKTTDGGKHWEKIYGPPMGGGDIVFLNSKVGWIHHNSPINGAVRLYKTIDGGINWEEQIVNTPSIYSDICFETGLPVFFSQYDGIMLASGEASSDAGKDIDSVAFITHDGGITWSLNTKDEGDKSFVWIIDKQDNSGDEFKVIYDKEIWNSTDGVIWEKTSDSNKNIVPSSTNPSASEKSVAPSSADISYINNYLVTVEKDSKTIRIPLKDIPGLYDELTSSIDLKSDSGISLMQFQLSRINPTVIYSSDGTDYILLNYNCGVKLCNYMLVKYNKEEISSLKVNFGLYAESKISPTNKLVALKFVQTKGNDVYHDIILIDLENMKLVSLNLPDAYTYVVLSYEWVDDDLNIKYHYDNKNKVETINYVFQETQKTK